MAAASAPSITLFFPDNTPEFRYCVSRKAFVKYSGWVNTCLAGHKELTEVPLPLTLRFPPKPVEEEYHSQARTFPPFPPAVEVVAAAATVATPDEADVDPELYEVAPDPYALFARTNAMTQAEASAIPAQSLQFLLQKVIVPCC